jgi:hypothetical protein
LATRWGSSGRTVVPFRAGPRNARPPMDPPAKEPVPHRRTTRARAPNTPRISALEERATLVVRAGVHPIALSVGQWFPIRAGPRNTRPPMVPPAKEPVPHIRTTRAPRISALEERATLVVGRRGWPSHHNHHHIAPLPLDIMYVTLEIGSGRAGARDNVLFQRDNVLFQRGNGGRPGEKVVCPRKKSFVRGGNTHHCSFKTLNRIRLL